jgi:hypothetical protein
MITPAKVDLTIYQGATFSPQFYWLGPLIGVPVTVVTPGVPTVVTAPAHLLPAQTTRGWFGKMGSSLAPVLQNDEADIGIANAFQVTKVSADTLSVLVNTQGLTYSGGQGAFYHNPPRDLTDYTARLRAWSTADDVTPVIDLQSPDGVVIDALNGGVQPFMSATDTDALDFTKLTYDLEVTDGDGVVTRLFRGTLTLQEK